MDVHRTRGSAPSDSVRVCGACKWWSTVVSVSRWKTPCHDLIQRDSSNRSKYNTARRVHVAKRDTITCELWWCKYNTSTHYNEWRCGVAAKEEWIFVHSTENQYSSCWLQSLEQRSSHPFQNKNWDVNRRGATIRFDVIQNPGGALNVKLLDRFRTQYNRHTISRYIINWYIDWLHVKLSIGCS